MEIATRVIRRDELDPSFTREVEAAAGTDIWACYQCSVCSGGCPISFMMDYTPRQIMRMVQLGMRETVLSSATIWLCSSCNTCFTRCPRQIELPEVMATLKSIAIKSGIEAKIREGPAFLPVDG
jgi:heterodisulfide reductase subunit C